eukprot:GCRY01003505.1.p1 GENE.GCRY01003505.1~~GCRY01003505.1.p1  ORF type:complete len:287 (-),score=36.80 GCRY01003505.1:286-1146(-)
MGNDGGSIPMRCEMVRTKEKKHYPNQVEAGRIKWSQCALTKEELRPPIVCCPLGHLFNKEAVIQHLLKKSLPKEFDYIKSLKDLHTLNLTRNPVLDQPMGDTVRADTGHPPALFACPITLRECGGLNRFVALIPCGCVVSEKIMKEIPDDSQCPHCCQSISSEDTIVLNGNDQDISRLKQRLLAKRAEKQHQKKEKKKQVRATTTVVKKPSDPANPKLGSSKHVSLSRSHLSVTKSSEAKIKKNLEKSATYKKLFMSEEDKAKNEREMREGFLSRAAYSRAVNSGF